MTPCSPTPPWPGCCPGCRGPTAGWDRPHRPRSSTCWRCWPAAPRTRPSPSRSRAAPRHARERGQRHLTALGAHSKLEAVATAIRGASSSTTPRSERGGPGARDQQGAHRRLASPHGFRPPPPRRAARRRTGRRPPRRARDGRHRPGPRRRPAPGRLRRAPHLPRRPHRCPRGHHPRGRRLAHGLVLLGRDRLLADPGTGPRRRQPADGGDRASSGRRRRRRSTALPDAVQRPCSPSRTWRGGPPRWPGARRVDERHLFVGVAEGGLPQPLYGRLSSPLGALPAEPPAGARRAHPPVAQHRVARLAPARLGPRRGVAAPTRSEPRGRLRTRRSRHHRSRHRRSRRLRRRPSRRRHRPVPAGVGARGVGREAGVASRRRHPQSCRRRPVPPSHRSRVPASPPVSPASCASGLSS